MRQNSGPHRSAEEHVKEIHRRTLRKFSAEQKIRIVLAGLRGEVRGQIIDLALEQPEFSSREPAVTFTDARASPSWKPVFTGSCEHMA